MPEEAKIDLGDAATLQGFMDTYKMQEHHIKQLVDVFKAFDDDGSGKIDVDEMMKMMESMGIVATKEAVRNMIAEVDTDGNFEIDFDELLQMITSNTGAAKGAGGFSFASIFARKKDAGPPILWRDDKKGEGITVLPGRWEVQGGGPNWGVQLCDMWISLKSYDQCSALLQLEELNGDCYIGVAGINFQGRDWNTPMGEESGAPWATVDCGTGKVYAKGRLADAMKTCEIVAGDRFNFNIDMHNSSMTCRVLRVDPKANTDPPTWMEMSSIIVDNLHNEIAICVAFGPTKDGMTSKIRIIGTSTEKSKKADASGSQMTEEQMRGGAMDEMTKQALSLQT
jgi:hypothetical protein